MLGGAIGQAAVKRGYVCKADPTRCRFFPPPHCSQAIPPGTQSDTGRETGREETELGTEGKGLKEGPEPRDGRQTAAASGLEQGEEEEERAAGTGRGGGGGGWQRARGQKGGTAGVCKR